MLPDQFFVTIQDNGKTALVLGPFFDESLCACYAYNTDGDSRGDNIRHKQLMDALRDIDPKSVFYAIGMVRVRDQQATNLKGILNKLTPGIWDKALLPHETGMAERRTPNDPYCPRWCQYSCTGAWKKGLCPIKTYEANKAFQYVYQQDKGPVALGEG